MQDSHRPRHINASVHHPPQLRVSRPRVPHSSQAGCDDGDHQIGGDRAQPQIEPAAGADERQHRGERCGLACHRLQQNVHDQETERGERDGPVRDLRRHPGSGRQEMTLGRGHPEHDRDGQGEQGQLARTGFQDLGERPAGLPGRHDDHGYGDHDQPGQGHGGQHVCGGRPGSQAGWPGPPERGRPPVRVMPRAGVPAGGSRVHQTSARLAGGPGFSGVFWPTRLSVRRMTEPGTHRSRPLILRILTGHLTIKMAASTGNCCRNFTAAPFGRPV